MSRGDFERVVRGVVFEQAVFLGLGAKHREADVVGILAARRGREEPVERGAPRLGDLVDHDAHRVGRREPAAGERRVRALLDVVGDVELNQSHGKHLQLCVCNIIAYSDDVGNRIGRHSRWKQA